MEAKIIGQKSFLAPLKEEDVQVVANWSFDSQLCGVYPNCITLKESYLNEYIKFPKDNLKIYMINTIDNITIGKLEIGVVKEENCANIDMVIAEKIYIGKGYGKDALKAVIKYCFEDLGLECIKMIVNQDNIRAEYCCWGCGLREDKYYIPDEKFENTLRMAVYKKDYIGY